MSEGSGRKALVVDGNGSRASETAAALRARGWEPVITRDAMLAFGAALKLRPGLVVLRDQLAGGGAPAAIAKLRASVHTTRAHIVVVGCEGGRTAADNLQAGAQACLADTAAAAEIAAATTAAMDPGEPTKFAPRELIADPVRLAAVRRFANAGSGNTTLHDLTRLAATLLGTKASMLTLVSEDRQTFIAQAGLDTGTSLDEETPLTHSFCQWVVSGREPVLVEDAREHDVLHANEAIDALGVISYAGVPISAGEEHTLGSFCTVDPEPRTWGAAELLVMKSLGKMVEAALVASVPRGPTPGREFVVMGHGIAAAGSLLRRIGDGNPQAAEDVTRFLERMSQELMVQALGYGGASAGAGQH